jgi:hypothetical protein
MTQAQMKQVAQQARQYGHFNRGFDAQSNCYVVEVKCPECRTAVQGCQSQYDPKGNTPAKALDRAMVDHLTYDCGQPPL